MHRLDIYAYLKRREDDVSVYSTIADRRNAHRRSTRCTLERDLQMIRTVLDALPFVPIVFTDVAIALRFTVAFPKALMVTLRFVRYLTMLGRPTKPVGTLRTTRARTFVAVVLDKIVPGRNDSGPI